MIYRPIFLFVAFLSAAANACSVASVEKGQMAHAVPQPPRSIESQQPSPTPGMPDLQAELVDDRNKKTTAPIGGFDFQNFTYELPRGWQNPDGTAEVTLTDGRIAPVAYDINEKMGDEEKAIARSQRRIGMSFVTAKYFDVTGDGQDEAVVVLKVETGGSAIPQLVYLFTWTDGKPQLIWPFRTGDRADGGLKDIRAEIGEMVVELYGQDRFLLGGVETGKITGDIEQLCCPTYFTRTHYKWNGDSFLMNKRRLTFSVADPHAPPIENLGDKVNAPSKAKK